MCSSNQFFVSDYMDVDKIPDNRHFQPLTFVTEVKRTHAALTGIGYIKAGVANA